MASFDILRPSTRLFLPGKSNAVAALALLGDRASAEEVTACAMAIYHMIGTSVELCLKAVYVDLGGHSLEHVRDRIGHSLSKALKAAEKERFPIDPNLRKLVEGMDKAHFKSHFRYLAGEPVNPPELRWAAKIACQLAMHVERVIGPDPGMHFFLTGKYQPDADSIEDMQLRVKCPECNRSIDFSHGDFSSGREVQCTCGNRFPVTKDMQLMALGGVIG